MVSIRKYGNIIKTTSYKRRIMAGNIIELWGMSAMCDWRVSGKHTLGLMTDVNFECYLMRWLKTLAFHKFSAP